MTTLKTSKWLALIALTLAATAVGLDMTVLNLALPTLASALHASTGDLQWFVDAYMLVLAAAMLPAGMLGDRFGRKKVLLLSLVVFGIGSLICAYATSPGMLIAARAVLGLGAAFLFPLALSVLPVLFSDAERPKAIAVLMVGQMIAFPIGPILGGWLLSHFWWGSVFLLNVPVVILALLAVGALLPESRSAARSNLDVIGILASSFGLVCVTYGTIAAGEHGFADPAALTTLGTGALAIVCFVLWERHIPHPLIDLTLFQSAGFTWGTVLSTLVNFSMFGVLFTVPQYFQEVSGTDALGSGIRLLPLVGGLLVGAPLASRLARLMGTGAAIALGFAVTTVGFSMGAATQVHSGVVFSTIWLVIAGIGLGFSIPTTMDAAIGALSVERSGVGSALIQAIRQAGGTIGVALLGALLSASYHSHLDVSGLPPVLADVVKSSVTAGNAVAHRLHSTVLGASVQSAFVSGMDLMLWIGAGIAVVSIGIALIFLPRRAKLARVVNTD